MNVAQEDLRKRLAFEIVLSELSSRFVNVGAADVDREIEEALRQVCKCLELDIAALWQLSPDEPGVFTMTHLFRVVDDPSVPEDFDARVYFPWALGKVISGDTVTLSSIDAAPVEAATDCETWRYFGIKSVFLFPLSTGGHRTFGAASFHSVEAERSYPDEIMRRLQLVSQIFANAVVRKRAEAELLESQERLQLAADAADIGMWALDIENQRFWGTDRARQIFGYEPDFDITMKAFLNSVHSDSRTPVSEEVRRALEEEREIDVEYRIVRPDGEVRWVYSRGRLRPATSTSPDVLMGASMDITERKDLEAKLVEQLRFEVLLSDVSARFVAVASEHVSREIEWALRDVGTFFGADRCGLLTAATNPRNVHANHVWYDTGIAQVAKELNLADLYPWAFDRLVVRKERLGFSSLEELPAEAGPDRESWIAEGVKSCLIVPLTSGDEVRHLLVIQCLRDECSWHESVVPRLQLLGTVLENALERRRAEEELERLRRQLELENAYLRQEHRLQLGQGRIVGESPAIMKVLGLVEQVAQTGSTVLIEGETGTGKELVAQRVHELSPRRDRPMVKVNCAALPSTLVESELFGHEKGAYTGAVSREPGRFEIADGSTIFLDEIAELPLDLQAKLLRVLEEGRFERVGSSRTLSTDVRVVAATNRDLKAEVEAKRFRSDLFFRLAVFPITLPPLRERRGDIPLLVWSMVQELSTGMNRTVESIRREDMERLQRYDWPGNVRELRNVVERALILSSGPTLRIEPPAGALRAEVVDDEVLSLDEIQRRHIVGVLEVTGGRIRGPGGAAELLGMKATTLRSRMERLGLDPRQLRNGANAT